MRSQRMEPEYQMGILENSSQKPTKFKKQMNVTEIIESLIKRGLVELTIGIVPKTKDELFIKGSQVVATGPHPANHQQITHQLTGAGLPELLTQLSRQIDHANEGKALIIQARKQ